MVALVLALALALAPHSVGSNRAAHHSAAPRSTAAAARATGNFPTKGIFVPGVSLAGVKLGYTQAQVKATWGPIYQACTYCTDVTWLYMYRSGEPLGAAARFEQGKVVAVFTLGSPAGWRTNKGLKMGDVISNVYSYYPTAGTKRCLGFDAITAQTGKVTSGFYSSAGFVYGFAMVIPGMTICQ